MPRDYNYEKLRPMDVLCTSASSLAGRLIRLYTARLRGFNGLTEFARQKMANHVAVVVEFNKLFWVAEMVDDGLKINSMRKYLSSKEPVVAIRRLQIFDDGMRRMDANQHLLTMANETRDYDYKMILQYLRIGQNEKSKYYCSELAESVANVYGGTWDAWNLMRSHRSDRMIAPVEVQYGMHCDVTNVLDYYV